MEQEHMLNGVVSGFNLLTQVPICIRINAWVGPSEHSKPTILRWWKFWLNLCKAYFKKDNINKRSNLTCTSDTAQGIVKVALKNRAHVSPGTQDKPFRLRHERIPKILERDRIIPASFMWHLQQLCLSHAISDGWHQEETTLTLFQPAGFHVHGHRGFQMPERKFSKCTKVHTHVHSNRSQKLV